jgi:hypothetical protein
MEERDMKVSIDIIIKVGLFKDGSNRYLVAPVNSI